LPQAELTSLDISAAVEAATTAQIRRNPVPKEAHTLPYAANPLKIQGQYARIKVSSNLGPFGLTGGVGPDNLTEE